MKPAGGGLPSAGLRLAALAGSEAVLLGARILQRGEAFTLRATILVTLAALAGLIGGGAYLVIARLGRGRPGPIRSLLLGTGIGGVAVLAAFYGLFALWRLTVEIDWSAPENGHDDQLSLAHLLIGTSIDSLGILATVGAPYFLPWTLPAMMIAAGIALANWRPRA